MSALETGISSAPTDTVVRGPNGQNVGWGPKFLGPVRSKEGPDVCDYAQAFA